MLVGRTSHRGTSQEERESEDKAGGPHLMVSDYPWPAVPDPVDEVITVGCFRTSAPKRKMVSSRGRIVSSALPDETIAGKIQRNQPPRTRLA
jgi:hypothetical protein